MLWTSSEIDKLLIKLDALIPSDTRVTRAQVRRLRVGGFYNRVGTLVNSGFVDGRFILRTIGSTAGQVWQKIEPLVSDEGAKSPGLFADFEGLIPRCASYLPIGKGKR